MAEFVVDGHIRFREGKKWKSRYACVSRPSPVADSLTLQLWRDKHDFRSNVNASTKGTLTFNAFLGIQTGFTLDRESFTMAVVMAHGLVVVAFDNRETLIKWQVRVNAQFEEGHQFSVFILKPSSASSASSLYKQCGSQSCLLHVQNGQFGLTTSSAPPLLIHVWSFNDLRRYGCLDETRFCFEGGSRCGLGRGLLLLSVDQARQVEHVFDLASKNNLRSSVKHTRSVDACSSSGETSSCETTSVALSDLANDSEDRRVRRADCIKGILINDSGDKGPTAHYDVPRSVRQTRVTMRNGLVRPLSRDVDRLMHAPVVQRGPANVGPMQNYDVPKNGDIRKSALLAYSYDTPRNIRAVLKLDNNGDQVAKEKIEVPVYAQVNKSEKTKKKLNGVMPNHANYCNLAPMSLADVINHASNPVYENAAAILNRVNNVDHKNTTTTTATSTTTTTTTNTTMTMVTKTAMPSTLMTTSISEPQGLTASKCFLNSSLAKAFSWPLLALWLDDDDDKTWHCDNVVNHVANDDVGKETNL